MQPVLFCGKVAASKVTHVAEEEAHGTEVDQRAVDLDLVDVVAELHPGAMVRGISLDLSRTTSDAEAEEAQAPSGLEPAGARGNGRDHSGDDLTPRAWSPRGKGAHAAQAGRRSKCGAQGTDEGRRR